jgi:hypothetical protein
MKDLEHRKESNSYMQLCLYEATKGDIYLMIPTFWDEIHKNCLGFVKTPDTGRLIHASGKDSKELENNFNIQLHKSFEEIPAETFSMFKPLEYWESRM